MAHKFGFLVIFLLLTMGGGADAARQCTSNTECACNFAVQTGSLIKRFCTTIACSQDSDCDRGDKCLAGVCTGNLCSSNPDAPSDLSCAGAPNQSACVANFLTQTECSIANAQRPRTCLTSECRPLTCTQNSQCGSGMRCNRIGASGYCDVTRSVSRVLGGGGGNPFTRPCHSDEVLVGMRVKFGSWIDSAAGRCVKVTSAGAWNGPIRTLAAVGGGGGNHITTLDCPNGHAISGFSGRGSSYVDQIGLECRLLASQDAFRIDDLPQTKGPAGGTGGQEFVPFHCPGHLPATSLNVRAGNFIDQMSLVCGR
jgi:hypothetical protein